MTFETFGVNQKFRNNYYEKRNPQKFNIRCCDSEKSMIDQS